MRMPLHVLILVMLYCLACRSPEQTPTVWFVHATDPHLFEEPGYQFQEAGNEKAFRSMLGALSSLPGMGIKPSFLVVTGDFGIAEPHGETGKKKSEGAIPPEGQKPVSGVPAAASGESDCDVISPPLTSEARAKRVDRLVAILAASPVRDIYIVPGNNDIRCEEASDEKLAEAGSFFEEVGRKLGGKVVLHDLSTCYGSKNLTLSQCWVDIPGTSFRLVAIPSYSFKNLWKDRKPNQTEEERKAEEANWRKKLAAKMPLQKKQMEKFAALVTQAKVQGRKVLVLSHVPEMDDPYTVAQKAFAGRANYNSQNPSRPLGSAWDVSPDVFQTWKDLVNGGTVAGVLAGHFHDSHREIYLNPARWSRATLNRADMEKLYLAPPLAARLQDTSPVQARGFSLMGLNGDRIQKRLYWYNPSSFSFVPESERSFSPTRLEVTQAVSWLWQLGTDKDQLARAALVAIALIAALLTVIATWEIPPPTTRSNPSVSNKPDQPSASQKGGLGLLSAPFQGNFASTVLGGLGGMAAVAFVDDSFWREAGVSAKADYLVLFVLFFLIILTASALYQGAVEAFRSRIVLPQQPPPWPAQDNGESRLRQRLRYWGRRFWRWLLSLRSSLLIFFDTAFNVVQGKNQLRTAGFGKAVVDLHWSIVWTADRVRKELDDAFLRALRKEIKKPEHSHLKEPEDADVRVNVSVLSEDGSSVSYISWERGSLAQAFDQHSVAWVSIYAGLGRWCKDGDRVQMVREPNGKSGLPEESIGAGGNPSDSLVKAKKWGSIYKGNQDVVLYENAKADIPGEAGKILLSKYYQPRDSSDYEAFVILPVPWSHRGETREYRKAGIQISFRKAGYLDLIWNRLEKTNGGKEEPAYESWTGLLEYKGSPNGDQLCIRNQELRAVLHQSLEVLGEVLRYFNPTIFEEQIRPHLKV